MSDPADDPDYKQLGEEGNPLTSRESLVEGNRVATAEDMESSSDEADEDEKPGYEGEAPNLPLADWGPRDGTKPIDPEQ
jgi:hypothetical protein